MQNSSWLSLLLVLLILITIIQFISCEDSPVRHVTCGSVIKLENNGRPDIRLHSHDIKYGSGSGQQSVTGAENKETNSYWTVLGKINTPCLRGSYIECGTTIRLQHVQTRKFLHSHHFQSPISHKQEVSAFGNDEESDTGDHWTIHCKSKYWLRGDPVKLKHSDTHMWLSVTSNSYGRPIYGQLEVVASTHADSSSLWKTAEGVFVKPPNVDTKDVHDEL